MTSSSDNMGNPPLLPEPELPPQTVKREIPTDPPDPSSPLIPNSPRERAVFEYFERTIVAYLEQMNVSLPTKYVEALALDLWQRTRKHP